MDHEEKIFIRIEKEKRMFLFFQSLQCQFTGHLFILFHSSLLSISKLRTLSRKNILITMEYYKSSLHGIFDLQFIFMAKILILSLLLIATVYTQDCALGQVRVKNQCVPLNFIEGCAAYRFDGLCETCEFGYDKTTDGACVSNGLQNTDLCCVERGLDGFCKKCANGLYLENNRCKRNTIVGCVAKFGPSCKACGNGYFINNNKCIRIIQGCEQYTTSGACVKCTGNLAKSDDCEFSYQLLNGICIKVKARTQELVNYVTKCKVKNAYGCLQCEKDFYLDSNKQCYPYEPGCLTYYKGKCRQCSAFRGFVLDQSGKCITNVQAIANCAQYQGLRCVGCRWGFRLINNQCLDERNLQIKIKKECAPGYYLSSDYKCKVASGNLIKDTDDDDKTTVVIREPGCIYQYGKCEYCQAPFQKINGKCTIPNCQELQETKTKTDLSYSCLTCRYPFQMNSQGVCEIKDCSKYVQGKCVLCAAGYHLKAGENCVKDDVNCKHYDEDGNCDLCADKYFISSIGECMLKQSNCLAQTVKANQMPVCTACADGFFLNRYNQCQKMDPNCDYYVNGVCKSCKARFFLYQFICFPYSVGCVKYNGKDCTECKKQYSLFNGECYSLKKLGMKLEGEDESYDFDIYPIDITKSKYYIDNLSPVSELGKFFCSSTFSPEYNNPSLTLQDKNFENEQLRARGWKALKSQQGQWAGFRLNQGEDPVTFYALQLEFIEKTEIKSFYLEYTRDGVKWIRVENRFFVDKHLNSDSPQSMKENGIITIYFTGVYAQAIRIVVDQFVGWPACRMEFFYYDMLRFRKISNLKSLKYLRESIQSNFVDRLDNQLYINQKYFFEPQFECHSGDDLTCFTGLELCEPRAVSYLDLINENKLNTGLMSYVSEFYLAYSVTGRNFECYNKCARIQVTQKDLVMKGNYQSYRLGLGSLQAKNIRVYPTKWVGTPKLSVFYDYK